MVASNATREDAAVAPIVDSYCVSVESVLDSLLRGNDPSYEESTPWAAIDFVVKKGWAEFRRTMGGCVGLVLTDDGREQCAFRGIEVES